MSSLDNGSLILSRSSPYMLFFSGLVWMSKNLTSIVLVQCTVKPKLKRIDIFVNWFWNQHKQKPNDNDNNDGTKYCWQNMDRKKSNSMYASEILKGIYRRNFNMEYDLCADFFPSLIWWPIWFTFTTTCNYISTWIDMSKTSSEL